jgi:hypothetical protein
VAISRTPIHNKTKGPLLENDDTWTLLVDSETQAKSVEHEWSYGDPYGKGTPNVGKTVITVEEFLSGDVDNEAKAKLNALLHGGG